MTPRSQIHIRLDRLAHNVRVIGEALRRPNAPRTRLCAVLKANAYGLGALPIAHALRDTGVDMIAVFTPDQARELAAAAVPFPVLMLAPVRELTRDDGLYFAASQGRLHFAVHDPEHLDRLVHIAESLALTLPLHLEIDTGMSRGGLPLATHAAAASTLLARIDEHPHLRLAGVFTHFASADCDHHLTANQHNAFAAWLDTVVDQLPPDCLIHEANSFALWRLPASHQRMVRIGLSLFGYASEEFPDESNVVLADLARDLAPVLRWTTAISQTKRIGVGAFVGYGATWQASRPTRLAIVPVGYADGYPLTLSNRAHAAIITRSGERHLAPVVGRISMDQTTLDVTDLPEADTRVGAPVELVSDDRDAPHALPNLAAAAGSITHELLCRLHPSITRRYERAGEASAAPSARLIRRV